MCISGLMHTIAGALHHAILLIRTAPGNRALRPRLPIWARDGQYTGARDALDLALAQDQILGGVDDPPGVQVMTIHKSKGKQFDGVIVIREGRHNGERQVSSFVWWDDEPPYWRSRKILRVGVTRAKVHTLILEHVFPACPIMAGHNL